MRRFFNPNGLSRFLHSTLQPQLEPSQLVEVQEICNVVSSSIGGLDDLETSLDRFKLQIRPTHVTQVIDRSKNEAPTRRLLRFFLWSCKVFGVALKDEDFNHVLRVVAEKKDYVGIEILVSDMKELGRVIEAQTFGVVANALVRIGREDDALGVFKNLEKFNCPRNGECVVAIVGALCAKGHAKKAQGVVWHHRDKVSIGEMECIYRSLVYGWAVRMDVKEARKVIQEMKGEGIMPDLFCYNTFLKGLCKRNLLRNPSGLVPEALNVMMEMRSYRIEPNSISYNVLLSCLGRTRRVKEACRVLAWMKKSRCDPDWVSYYLVVRVLYLSERFGKGNQLVDEMTELGLVPDRKFFYDLIGILCGVERVNFALELFERMKRSQLGGYGPVYDVLIPKLCREGNFEKGRELWDEATNANVALCCTSDVLDPSVTEVFKPTRKVIEEVRLRSCIMPRSRERIRKTRGKVCKKLTTNKKKKKSARRYCVKAAVNFRIFTCWLSSLVDSSLSSEVCKCVLCEDFASHGPYFSHCPSLPMVLLLLL